MDPIVERKRLPLWAGLLVGITGFAAFWWLNFSVIVPLWAIYGDGVAVLAIFGHVGMLVLLRRHMRKRWPEHNDTPIP